MILTIQIQLEIKLKFIVLYFYAIRNQNGSYKKKKKPKWIKPKITLKPFVYLGLNKNFASLHQRPKESNHKIIHM